MLPSVLWHCWFGIRKSIQPVKKIGWWCAGMVICQVQSANIWTSWCNCHPIISCFIKIQNGSPFWWQLTHVVLERTPLNDWCCTRYDGVSMQKVAGERHCLKLYKPQSHFARLWLELQCKKACSRCTPAVEKAPSRRARQLRKPPLDAHHPLCPAAWRATTAPSQPHPLPSIARFATHRPRAASGS